MSYDPIDHLGLTCPSGGSFYICQDSEIQFLGCCDVDPCGSNGGNCPSSSLRPSSFEPKRYSEIQEQNCTSSSKTADWYSCRDSAPSFLGCCTLDACANEGCPGEDLVGAVLSNDIKDKEAFLSSTTTSSTEIAVTPTSNPTSSLTADPASGGSSGAPVAGIVGGVLGGLIALGLVILAYFLYRRRRRRALSAAPAMASPPPPWSPYQDGFRSPGPVSPPSSAASPRGFSTTLGSMIGLSPKNQRWSYRTPSVRDTVVSDWAPTAHDTSHASQGFLAVTELDGSVRVVPGPTHTGAYYEVEGSVPDTRPREMAS
ncbi:hypothetical protein F5B22DRAFT_659934 [Xylaria bambusicola]|uniref:uncharacterized protein n=1 Tax=Xylaria bambusicola TaxID=326684 RepID=UPI0020084879|nr:uncharacterized protein F5B22DRAFT_659934 [Xylaria bambusicola]KAI0506721.1 hypothetical protein F5B22DRAFT_659934 [Xylaria bambusicola]